MPTHGAVGKRRQKIVRTCRQRACRENGSLNGFISVSCALCGRHQEEKVIVGITHEVDRHVRDKGKKVYSISLDFHCQKRFATCWITLTAHAQVLKDSQRCSDDSAMFRSQSVLDGNDDLRNNGQDLLASSVEHVVNGVASHNVVRKFGFAQSDKRGNRNFIGMTR